MANKFRKSTREEKKKKAEQDLKDTKEEIFVIGGGMVYRQMLPYSKKMYLTEIDAICDDAQVYFPNFDNLP